ncbi:MAG: methyltransferase domain-containing protein [Firmicutes bacterium]|nr:methyltransferase domain-containing protein [Bacillota bacterium]
MLASEEQRKIEVAKALIMRNKGLFRCPVCEREMVVTRTNSVICRDGHNFDLAKQGYINLLLKQGKSEYDRKLFAARKVISNSGFFDPMRHKISELIYETGAGEGWSTTGLLDAGCGEGSHLAQIISDLNEKGLPGLLGVGIDLSKEGIRLAAKDYQNIIWCVADLTKLPLQNGQFEVVLNILSPANYGEFKRVLKERGILIKVIPASNYLIELREILYRGTDRELYINDSVIRLFAGSFQMIRQERINYKVLLKEENLEHLIKMTPLTWNASHQQLEEIMKVGLKSITVAFDVLVGRK